MENPSDPERSPSDNWRPTYVRPPGLELAMGVALFAVIFIVFFMVQSVIFLAGVISRSPEYAGFSVELLEDPAFQARMNELVFHGDLVAHEALWSGLIGTGLILLSVYLWKKRNMATFLGLHLPGAGRFLKWLGIFLLLGLVIEVVTRISPEFQSDFMSKVLATSTNKWFLFIGVGLMAPLFEEFLLRGLLFGSLRHLADEHVTVALTAGVFTVMHMQYNAAIMLLILPMGVVLGYARSRSGSIWVPVFLHVLNNTVSVLIPPATT